MRRWMALVGLCVVSTLSAQQPQRIMFGSCLDETRAHPVLSVAVDREPDLFVFLGDNVYADSEDPAVIERSYDRLGASPLFAQLAGSTRIVATWDDHDYGRNDAGREFSAREASEQAFESFWDVSGPAARRPGVYQLIELGEPDRRVQVILLDTRYFRTSLPRASDREPGKGPYGRSDTGTILGPSQWLWLEEVLARPADLRIVASSIQVLAEHHGWESWANFPHERERLLELVAESTGEALFISGDRHFAEISRRQPPVTAETFIDVTSSGINRGYPDPVPTENSRRVQGYYLGHNVGELELEWPSDGGPPLVISRIIDVDGTVRLEHAIDW